MKFVKYESVTCVDVDSQADALKWAMGRFIPREGTDDGQLGDEAYSFKAADSIEELESSPELSLTMKGRPDFYETEKSS